jgi:hypothetical protein
VKNGARNDWNEQEVAPSFAAVRKYWIPAATRAVPDREHPFHLDGRSDVGVEVLDDRAGNLPSAMVRMVTGPAGIRSEFDDAGRTVHDDRFRFDIGRRTAPPPPSRRGLPKCRPSCRRIGMWSRPGPYSGTAVGGISLMRFLGMFFSAPADSRHC